MRNQLLPVPMVITRVATIATDASPALWMDLRPISAAKAINILQALALGMVWVPTWKLPIFMEFRKKNRQAATAVRFWLASTIATCYMPELVLLPSSAVSFPLLSYPIHVLQLV